MKTFEEAYHKAMKENGCNYGSAFAKAMFKYGADNLIEQASANGQKKYQQGMDFMKDKAIEALSSVLGNWVHGGDADCIIAEFEERLDKQRSINE